MRLWQREHTGERKRETKKENVKFAFGEGFTNNENKQRVERKKEGFVNVRLPRVLQQARTHVHLQHVGQQERQEGIIYQIAPKKNTF